MNDGTISEYKMKTQKESNSDGRIEDALTTRILILTLAAIKAGKVAEERNDRSHEASSADGRLDMIANLTVTKITLTGTTIAGSKDHNEDLLLLVGALELQAVQPLEPPGPPHGTVLVGLVLVQVSRMRILIRLL